MEFLEVHEYLVKLRTAADYKELERPEQESSVFEANELLKDHIPETQITKRIVALQTLFMIEGEDETFAMLRRQGVKSYSVKGISVSLEAVGIAPSVIDILYPKSMTASVGRLV